MSLMWISEQPEQSRNQEQHSVYSEDGARKRVHHRKSRNGCNSCRQRRIKCDEGKPICSYCIRMGKDCQYPAVEINARSRSRRIPASQPEADTSLLSVCLKGHVLRALENASDLDPDLADFVPAIRLHALESLNHFATCDSSWLKARKIQVLMQKPAIRLVIDHQYLLHAVLAVSNAHLAALKPEQTTYATAARLHWQHSLQLYGHRLDGGFEKEDVDAIYFASQLHAILSFVFTRLPVDSQGYDSPAAWLVAMRYKTVLFETPLVVERLQLGFWKPLVAAHYNWLDHADRRIRGNQSNTPSRSIQAIMQYAKETGASTSVYHERQMEYIMMLERVPAINDAIGAFLSFITEAPNDFIKSLQRRDTLSLLMLLYWTMLVAQIPQWWLAQAAVAERRNLHRYLVNLDDIHLAVAVSILDDEHDHAVAVISEIACQNGLR